MVYCELEKMSHAVAVVDVEEEKLAGNRSSIRWTLE